LSFIHLESTNDREGQAMRVSWTIVAAIVLALIAQHKSVAAQPSQSVLTEMGLGGMQILSDEAAMNIRGQGFASKKVPTPPTSSKADWYRQARLNYEQSKAEFYESIHPTPVPEPPNPPHHGGGKHPGGKFHFGGAKL
jgi:hypothetical protein